MEFVVVGQKVVHSVEVSKIKLTFSDQHPPKLQRSASSSGNLVLPSISPKRCNRIANQPPNKKPFLKQKSESSLRRDNTPLHYSYIEDDCYDEKDIVVESLARELDYKHRELLLAKKRERRLQEDLEKSEKERIRTEVLLNQAWKEIRTKDDEVFKYRKLQRREKSKSFDCLVSLIKNKEDLENINTTFKKLQQEKSSLVDLVYNREESTKILKSIVEDKARQEEIEKAHKELIEIINNKDKVWFA